MDPQPGARPSRRGRVVRGGDPAGVQAAWPWLRPQLRESVAAEVGAHTGCARLQGPVKRVPLGGA